MYLYFPLLIISLILFIWQFSIIRDSLSSGLNDLKDYFKPDKSLGEDRGDLTFRILFDIIIAGIILFMGLFVFGV